MISTLIFDMGNVLLEFKPQRIVSHYTQEPETVELLTHAIFHQQEWLSLDLGTLSDQQAIDSICQRLDPKLHDLVKQIVLTWPITNRYDEAMIGLVYRLKNKGFKLVLASNASTRFYEYKKDIRALDVFDGILISADIHLAKPDPAYYEHLLSQFELDPSSCFMIDDMKANIEGAARCKIKGTIFTGDIKKLENTLKEQGIL